MLKDSYPYYLANRPVAPNEDLEVFDKYTLQRATRVAMADQVAIERALGFADEASGAMRQMAAYERR